jgi:hypothetical protein
MGPPTTLACTAGWNVVPSPSIGNLDNNLTAVSAASPSDAWAVGDFYNSNNPGVLVNMAEHWDGQSWTEYALPDVGPNLNTLLGVSELPSGDAWAVGYYVNGSYTQQTLIQHYDGSTWSVIPSPSPGAQRNILYGVAALSDADVWAVGAQQDTSGTWHTLTEHWDGTAWSVVPSVDLGAGGDLLYSIRAVSNSSVYAAGQQSGTAFPDAALVEHWNGKQWSTLPTPTDNSESLNALGVTGTDASLTVAGTRESDTAAYSTFVASGPPQSLGLLTTPNQGSGEQDLFAAATAADGSTWAAGWDIDPTTGNHRTLVEHGLNGQWSVVTSPDPGSGDNGFAGIGAVPGGGLWAVGITATKGGNPSTLIAYHC